MPDGRHFESEVGEMMGTAIAILIGVCLLLIGVVAFLLGLVSEYQRAEKRYYTPVDVEPLDWEWHCEVEEAEYEQEEESDTKS